MYKYPDNILTIQHKVCCRTVARFETLHPGHAYECDTRNTVDATSVTFLPVVQPQHIQHPTDKFK